MRSASPTARCRPEAVSRSSAERTSASASSWAGIAAERSQDVTVDAVDLGRLFLDLLRDLVDGADRVGREGLLPGPVEEAVQRLAAASFVLGSLDHVAPIGIDEIDIRASSDRPRRPRRARARKRDRERPDRSGVAPTPSTRAGPSRRRGGRSEPARAAPATARRRPSPGRCPGRTRPATAAARPAAPATGIGRRRRTSTRRRGSRSSPPTATGRSPAPPRNPAPAASGRAPAR